MTRLLPALLATALLVPVTASLAAPAAHAATPTLHYTANEDGAFQAAHALGYNLHDPGPTPSEVDSLPGNDRAVVWLGEKCPTGVSPSFASALSALGHDPRVLAYYLSDEPHANGCPKGPANLAAEADYIHGHTAGQLAFIVLIDEGSDYATFAPGTTHVDAVGLDPYPCNVNLGGCDYQHIDDQVHQAEAAGIGQNVIVPTFQAFGNNYYLMPSAGQLQSILNEWAALVPHPVFDYTYSWGCQGGSLSSCLSTSPPDQQVMAAHNTGHSTAGPATTTSPPPAPGATEPGATEPGATEPAATVSRAVKSITSGRPPPPAGVISAVAATSTTGAAPSTTAATDPTGSPFNHTHRPSPQARPRHRAGKHHHHSGWSTQKRIALAFLLLSP